MNPNPHPLGIAGGLTRAFIASPLTPLLLLASLALGLVALVTLPREEEPQISVPMVDIHVEAPGLRAEDAVELVTAPLEAIIKSIDAVEHVYSQTRDDGAMVTARFEVGTDADDAILRVHEKVRANLDRIPVGIPEPLVVGRGIDDVAIVVLTFTPEPQAADRISASDLTRIAREVRTEVAKIADVGLTYIVGEKPVALRVSPDPARLAEMGVTLQGLAAKLEGANRAFPVGTIPVDGDRLALAAGETLASPAEIGNLLLTTRDGRPVYVRDVADVAFAFDTADTHVLSWTRGEGDALTPVPAVSLAVAKRPGSNAVDIAHAVVERVESLRGSLIPADVVVGVTRDYGESANEKANELLFHLALATVSIIVLVGIAIGLREALVVAIVIPVTILLTLFAANLMGYTLNRVSLFALIFAIGILVDDAIVVIENIARHWGMPDGRNRIAAAIDAVAEVGNPTIVATLTVVAALLPMLFVSGLMGPYMSPIPAVASAAMIVSFFVAVMVTPWLMVKLGKAHHAGGHGAAAVHPGGLLGRLYAGVARPLVATRARAIVFLTLVGLATLAAMVPFYTRDVTVKLLPFDDKTELAIMVDLREGASVEATSRVLGDVAHALAGMEEVVALQSYAGTAAPFDFNGLVRHTYLRAEPQLGEVRVILTGKADRDRASHPIALEMRERLAGLDVPAGTSLKVVEPPPGPPVLATLLAEIYGPDAETRRAVAAKVRQAFEAVPFVVDVDDSYGTPAERQRLALVDDALDFHRVEQRDVFDTIGLLWGERTVGYSHRGEGRAPIPIVLTRASAERRLGEDALTTPIPANLLPGARGVVELGDVVEIVTERASNPIYRRNGRASEMVTAELAGDFEAPLYGMLAVEERLAAMEWGDLPPPTIRYAGQPEDESAPVLLWDGEWEVTYVTFRDMGAAFAVALLAIYALVVAQFGSFKAPLVVLTPVPLTLIGIVFGHWLFSAPFSATSMIGFIALAGIIVRNSILLIDFIRHTEQGERTLVEVLIDAGAVRFKPILLTALAAMIGAGVILFDPIFQGLAISLLFGLISSTLLTVIVIPAIYVAIRGKTGRATMRAT